MAAAKTGEGLFQQLLEHRLLSAEQIDAVRADLDDGVGDEDVAAMLRERGLLTDWQLEQLSESEPVFFLDNDRYLLLRQIGEGGTGAVYQARHTRMNRDVALKIIDPRRITDQRLVDRFRREVAVTSKLQHEHIVQAYDVGIEADVSFLVLEYVEGSDLALLVGRDGPMEPGEAAAIGMQAASALSYAHAQGIVHRDIKPQNILLSTAGVTKVLDMGLARIVETSEVDDLTALTQEGAIMGTVDFMSPEQAMDTHAADRRSDIYSLGATLYFLLSGRKPFPGGSAMEKLMRLANKEPQPLGQIRPDCPFELVAVVERMMAKDPQARFQSAEEVVRSLQALAAETISGRAVVTQSVQTAAVTNRTEATDSTATDPPVLAPPADSVLGMFRRRQKRPQRGGLIAGAAIVLALLVAGAVWKFGKPPGEGEKLDGGGGGNGNGTVIAPPGIAMQPPAEYRVELPGHFGGITPADWSPDGRSFATYGEVDGRVLVWNADDAQPLASYRGHRAGVVHARFSPDGTLIVSCDHQGGIHVWKAMTGDPIASIERPSEFAGGAAELSPGNRELAYVDGDRVIRYSLVENQPVWSAGHTGFGRTAAHTLRYSLDGKLLGFGQRLDADDPASVSPMVWDVTTGELVYQRQSTGPFQFAGFGRDNLLVLYESGKLKLFDAESEQAVAEWPVAAEPAHPLRLSSRGDLCRVDGQLIKLATGQATQAPGRIFSPNGTRVVSYSGTPTAVWAVRKLDGTPLTAGFGLLDVPQPARLELLAGRYARTEWGWFELSRARMVSGFPDVAHVFGDGRLRGLVRGRVLEWTEVDELGSNFAVVSELADADEYLQTAALQWTGDGSRIWAVSPDRQRVRFWDPDAGTHMVDVELGPPQGAWQLGFSPGGDVLAVLNNSRVTIWNVDELTMPRAELESIQFTGAVSRDGRLLTGSITNLTDIALYDVESGRLLNKLDAGYGGGTQQFSPEGDYFLANRQIWDLSEAQSRRVWQCPQPDRAVGTKTYRNGAWFADSKHVLICQDAEYQVWDWRANEKLLTFFLLPEQQWAAVNHRNGHWKGTQLAFTYLRCRYEGRTEWLTPRQYEKLTGWKRDVFAVGLAAPEGVDETAE